MVTEVVVDYLGLARGFLVTATSQRPEIAARNVTANIINVLQYGEPSDDQRGKAAHAVSAAEALSQALERHAMAVCDVAEVNDARAEALRALDHLADALAVRRSSRETHLGW